MPKDIILRDGDYTGPVAVLRYAPNNKYCAITYHVPEGIEINLTKGTWRRWSGLPGPGVNAQRVAEGNAAHAIGECKATEECDFVVGVYDLRKCAQRAKLRQHLKAFGLTRTRC